MNDNRYTCADPNIMVVLCGTWLIVSTVLLRSFCGLYLGKITAKSAVSITLPTREYKR